MASTIFLTLLLSSIFHLGASSASNFKYPFVKEATDVADGREYDYIVAGGGAAGCALAATLSAKYKVLLLERGGVPYGVYNIEHAEGFHRNLLEYDNYTSVAQHYRSEDGVGNHRGRVLGGGTALNAGFYTRASPNYVRKAGWDGLLVNESYHWVENKVVFKPVLPKWQSALKNALLEVGVGPDNGFTYDHVIGTKVSGVIFDPSGKRHTAADLLEYADPRNIEVVIRATAKQILFHTGKGAKPQAYAIEYIDTKGKVRTAHLSSPKGDIIVSAGAVGSPQLLLLSGVGPRSHLEEMHIPVVAELETVGKEMADNPNNVFVSPGKENLEYSLVDVVGITKFGSYIEELSGGPNTTGVISLFISLLKDPTKLIQPVYLSLVGNPPALVSDRFPQLSYVLQKVAGPSSKGELKLATKDPRDNPKVRYNYYSDPRDVKKCIRGVRTIARAFKAKAYDQFAYPSTDAAPQAVQALVVAMGGFVLLDSDLKNATSMAQFCKDSVITIWHAHGGCVAGKVVNPVDHKVFGVQNLRVVDISTLADTPGANPQATVMMLGRYMGLKILENRPST